MPQKGTSRHFRDNPHQDSHGFLENPRITQKSLNLQWLKVLPLMVKANSAGQIRPACHAIISFPNPWLTIVNSQQTTNSFSLLPSLPLFLPPSPRLPSLPPRTIKLLCRDCMSLSCFGFLWTNGIKWKKHCYTWYINLTNMDQKKPN